ncbi:trypsin-like serine peptidase [Thalassovita aquimarina]|uniref:Trypsin-like serine protease n=1 Tax=Thalassovita aquimarina TaxID=2785917 RepID=A0ABS5HMD0_9RHOB|nr:trypsin-like peptidase domain-containing protein [Thalassovita aquimarina]MBR9650131.1 trypsin-like serine protease [Thalassovita aquimarina]
MLHRIVVLVSFLFAAGIAQAQDTMLRRLSTGEDSKGWEAVGRLDLAGAGFCTGALIAPDLVLTAAHCLFDPESGNRIDQSRIEFQAGMRNGRAEAYRWVRRAVVHPSYRYDGPVSAERVRNDLALLELEQPIRNGTVTPFKVARVARPGDQVGVVSYAQNRAEAPSMQDVCRVKGRQQGVLVMSCDIDFGSSGSPVFSFAGGQKRIVSVISAKAQAEGERVALGSQIDGSIDLLRSQLANGVGILKPTISQARRVRVGDARETSGAKFLKQ